jgi:serine/threonine protein kinase/predicted negative regulator of RcsB-dependent stress response
MTSPHEDPADDGPLPPGTRLRHYVVRDVLGVGGFGITYRAGHATLTNKIFALKEYFPHDFAIRRGAAVGPVPSAEELYEFGRRRFLQEAEILALCSHPAIVDVVDHFEENGTAYTVLEYVPGVMLKDWLAALGRQPTQDELDTIMEPLLGAIEVVHARNLLHRDIAPDNILIRPDGMPCLIDFGAARMDMGVKAERTAMIIKFGYSPPEQYSGDGLKQSAATDLYAMAATLYRAIVGAPPPDSMRRAGVAADRLTVPESLRAPYRPRFLAAIENALELDVGRRPQSMNAWRAELMAKGGTTAETDSEEGPPAPVPASELVTRFEPPARKPPQADVPTAIADTRPTPISTTPAPRAPTTSKWAIAVGVGLVLAGGAYALRRTDRTPASAPQLSAGQAPAPAPGPSVQAAPVPAPAPPTACTTGEAAQRVAACLALLQSVPPQDTAAVYRATIELGRAYRAGKDRPRALSAFGDAINLRPAEAAAYNQRALVLIDQNRLDDALADLSKSIERDPKFGEAYNNRAWLLLRQKQTAAALADVNIAVGLLPDKAYVWNTRGQINEQLDPASAVEDYRKAVAVEPAAARDSLDALKRLGAR